MLRYLGLVWNPKYADSTAVAGDISRRLNNGRLDLDQAGLRIYVWPNGIGQARGSVQLSNDAGLIVGDLFLNTSTDPAADIVTELDSQATAAIRDSAGKSLVSNYWGRYVAFVRMADSSVAILRDPTGRLPCFILTHGGVHLIFSHLEDIQALGSISLTVNWDYIAVRSIASVVETHDTALREVKSILGGERLLVRDGSVTRSMYWQPSQFLSPLIDDAEYAAAKLRSTTKRCVQTWAQKHQSVVSMLSGGLDSSIVSACLAADRGPRVTCLNLYSSGARSDEREYARLVATRSNLPLIEEGRDPNIDLTSMLSLTPTVIPFHYPYKLEIANVQTKVLTNAGATAIFDGNGGDGILYATPIEPTLRDYRHHHGITKEYLNVAIDVARHEQSSLWHVLRSAFAENGSSVDWDPLSQAYDHRKLVRRDVIDQVRRERRFLHPWLQDLSAIPPGKRWHIFYMAIPLNFDHQIGGNNACELVLPLISQPIFELLLRVPTYLLTQGGKDRALARRAFRDDLPSEIINRSSKGFREEFTRSILDRNRDFAREMLLGGLLVQNRILDGAKLEETLSGRPEAVGASTSEIFSHLSLEVWLQHFAS